MKKGLLTVLLASLVLVGCQNYDDQFDDLNAQISALKSQVDGLASLSGQVSSLSGSISGLSAGVAAAQAAATAAGASADAASAAANGIDLTGLASSLATLQAEVDAVQASLATTSTASAVAALQAEIDAIEADVDELLSTSNIYSTNVTVNSASTLDAALALGNKLNILNATATITVSAAMDQTKVQTLVNRMNTLTGNLVFNSSSTTETTFNNLLSAEDITMNQKGGYQMQKLTSASNITLNDQYEANITIVDLRALATVTTLTTSGETDAGIQFDKATEVHLSKLARYPGSQLTIITKEGGVLDMPLLDDQNTLAAFEATNLTLNGPATFTTTLLTDSTMSFTNVATVNVTGNRGSVDIDTGVENATLTDVVTVTVDGGADDLETLSVDFKSDDEPTLTTAETTALRYDADAFVADDQGDLDVSGLANLTSVTVSGTAGDINIDANPNLTTVTISADAKDLYLVDNDNMTSVTVTGAKFGSIEVSGNADLATLALDSTTALRSTSTTAAEKSVAINVNANPELTSLTASMDDVSGLIVKTNAKLATVDFTGMADDGSTTTGSYAHIFNNNLTFDLVKDQYNDTDQLATYVASTLTDDGSTTGGGGIKTLKAWLQHVDGSVDTTNGVYVFVDAITKYEVQGSLNGAYTDTAVPSAPTVTTQAQAFSNNTSLYAVAALEAAETSTSGTDRSETRQFVMPVASTALYASDTTLTAGDAVAINLGGLSKTFKKGDVDGSTTVSSVANMVSYINGDTSWGSDITITAQSAGYMRNYQTVNFTNGNGTANTISSAGNLWFKLGTTPVSGALGVLAGAPAASIASAVATAIEASNQSAANGGYNQYLYNASHITGTATVLITRAESMASYPDNVRPDASAIPQVTFVFDMAGGSTTAGFSLGGTSNVLGLNETGSTSGFFLNTTTNTNNGMAVKIVNGNAGIQMNLTAVSPIAMAITATSGVIGGTGPSAYVALQTAPTVAELVSNTNFSSASWDSYAIEFADISSATTSTDQAAATTNRTGWL